MFILPNVFCESSSIFSVVGGVLVVALDSGLGVELNKSVNTEQAKGVKI